MKSQQRSHQFCFSGATFRKSTRTPHCREFLPYPMPQKLHGYIRAARHPGGQAPSHSAGRKAGRPRSCLCESLPRPPAEHCTRFRQGCSPAPPLYPFTGSERYRALDRSFLEERNAGEAALGHLSRASFCARPPLQSQLLLALQGARVPPEQQRTLRERRPSGSTARSRLLPTACSCAAPYHVNDAISIETKKASTTSEAALNYGTESYK